MPEFRNVTCRMCGKKLDKQGLVELRYYDSDGQGQRVVRPAYVCRGAMTMTGCWSACHEAFLDEGHTAPLARVYDSHKE